MHFQIETGSIGFCHQMELQCTLHNIKAFKNKAFPGEFKTFLGTADDKAL